MVGLAYYSTLKHSSKNTI